MEYNPALSFAQGLSIARNWRKDERDEARQNRLDARQEVLWAQQDNDRARADQDREFGQLANLYKGLSYDAQGNYVGDAALTSPKGVDALNQFIQSSTYVKRLASDAATNMLSPDELKANGPRELVGVQPSPNPGKVVFLYKRNNSTGPQTKDGSSGDDAVVVEHDANDLGEMIRNTVAAHNPEVADQLRAAAQTRKQGDAAADIAGLLYDKNNPSAPAVDNSAAIAAEQAKPPGYNQDLQTALASPPAQSTASAAPAPNATMVNALQRGLDDYLAKNPGAPKFDVGSPARDTYDRMAQNLEKAKAGTLGTPPAPAAPTANTKADEARAQIQATNATIARLKQAERAGKVNTGTRDKLTALVRANPALLPYVTELMKRPEIDHVIDAKDRAIVIRKDGTRETIPYGDKAEDLAKLAKAGAEADHQTYQDYRDFQSDILGLHKDGSDGEKQVVSQRLDSTVNRLGLDFRAPGSRAALIQAENDARSYLKSTGVGPFFEDKPGSVTDYSAFILARGLGIEPRSDKDPLGKARAAVNDPIHVTMDKMRTQGRVVGDFNRIEANLVGGVVNATGGYGVPADWATAALLEVYQKNPKAVAGMSPADIGAELSDLYRRGGK